MVKYLRLASGNVLNFFSVCIQTFQNNDMNSLVIPADGNCIADRSTREPEPASDRFYNYGVYGIRLHSQMKLSLPKCPRSETIKIDLISVSASFFSKLTRGVRLQRNRFSSFDHAYLDDGSIYIRWEGLGEFLVSMDGSRIACRRFDKTHGESFQVYLLGQALSFALVKNGLEPLHATCVVVDGAAVVLLGNSGFGKSSLAACFLSAGYSLLTDDLLVLRGGPKGLLAYPGPARIKLFPAMARRFLGRGVKGLLMNSAAQKLVIPLGRGRICSMAVPVRAVYALVSPREVSGTAEVRIASLSLRKAFVTVLNNTFNYVIVYADRLRRQFLETTLLVNSVRVKSLTYPRKVSSLPSVRDTILADLTRDEIEVSSGRYTSGVVSETRR